MRKKRLQFKRKREGKTNYKKRLGLLKSRTHRIVIRRTNNYLIAQIIDYSPEGDKVLVGLSSKALKGLGWKQSCNNLPAGYLTGLLLGKKAQEKGIKKAILDIGLQTPHAGSKIFSVLKGVIEAGVEVPSSKEAFPSEDRLVGKHISDGLTKDVEAIKSKI